MLVSRQMPTRCKHIVLATLRLRCRRCYEVKCDPRTFTDGYGEVLDRTTVCYDPTTSVVIQIVDACPCSYPGADSAARRGM